MTTTTETPVRFAAIVMGGHRGPVHQEVPGGAWGQAWCGVRRQFRHRTYQHDTTCPKCLRAIKRGRPYARGSK